MDQSLETADFIVETERLILRTFNPGDDEALMQVFADPEVMRYGNGTQNAEWVTNWITSCLFNYDRLGFGLWAVVEKRSGKAIGYCGLTQFPNVNGRSETEIGFRLAKAYWGNGFATEAALAVRDFAFNILKLQRLIAIVDSKNANSINVIKKIGMQYEQDVMLEGYSHPDHVYAVTANVGSVTSK